MTIRTGVPSGSAPEPAIDLDALAEEAFGRTRRRLASLEKFRAPPPDDIVLVDWTVSYLQAWVAFSVVGVHLSWLLNACPWSLVYAPGQVSPLGRMAHEAFGYQGEIDLSALLQEARAGHDLAVLVEKVRDWPREGAGLRRCLLDLEFEGLPVGDLVYDTYIRQSGQPTVTCLDGFLQRCIIEAHLHYQAADALLRRHKVRALITTHRVYYHLGVLSRLALARGVPVIESGAVNPFRIKYFRNFLDAMDDPIQFSPRELDKLIARDGDAAVAFGRAYMERRQASTALLHVKESEVGAYGASRRIYNRDELCAAVNWDPAKPIAPIMTHVFVEAPHFSHNAFDDYYLWVEETLKIAARNDRVQWLLKKHPDSAFFDEELAHSPLAVKSDEVLRRLMEPYRDCPHIALCPEDLNTGALLSQSKAIVTVFGTAGPEFAAMGVPVISAGMSSYYGQGFSIDCMTPAAYEAALMRLDTFEPLDEVSRRRALAFLSMYYDRSRPMCSLLPPMAPLERWALMEEREFLEGLLARADAYQPREDPLYQRLGLMLRHGYTSAFDFGEG